MLFQTDGKCGQEWSLTVCVCGGEVVSIHIVRKGMAGFSYVKSITFSTLKLVD